MAQEIFTHNKNRMVDYLCVCKKIPEKILCFYHSLLKADALAEDNEASDAIENGMCVICGNRANVFRSEQSLREYDKIGYCQSCQEEIFGS